MAARHVAGVVESVGEVQPRFQIPQGPLHGGTVLDRDLRKAQQMAQHCRHFLGLEAVVAPEHPLELQHHGLA
ncbi:MAG: hypothetical protein ACK55I_04760, partial [bacterium]